MRGTGADWDEMERVIAESADAPGDAALLDVDRRCHEIIWHAAGNRFLTDTLDVLYAQSDRVWHMYLADVADTRHAVDEHADILDILRSGDADASAAAVEAHVQVVRRSGPRRRDPPAAPTPRRVGPVPRHAGAGVPACRAMTWELLARLLLAIVVGGAIGAERESRDKPAGFRTMTLICLGSALFTTFSATLTEDFGDPSRIAAQIVTGVGFLGAGAIIREAPRVSGLTTAATIWIAAALGMGVGAGEWGIALTAAAFTVLVLIMFPSIERVDRSQA